MHTWRGLKAQIPLRLLGRYGALLVRHGSLQKLRNFAHALYCWVNEQRTISTMPAFLKVEVSRQCTVNCLGCHAPKDQAFVSLHEFKRIVDWVQESALMVQLHEIGEPLLHPQILQCIQYAHAAKLATVTSSSLSVDRPDSFWSELTEAGLDYLVVAIDGVTPQVYSQYRTHGDLELVMGNLHRILNRRSRTRRTTIEWQMIDLPWNRHEQPIARSMALKLGCDVFRVIPDTRKRSRYDQEGALRNRNCLWPFLLLLVNAYGDVLPCFKPDCGPKAVGNVYKQSFQDIWNGEKIQCLRDRSLITHCQGCRTCPE